MVLALGWPILFSGRAPLWCGLTALSCSACLISRGFAPGWHGSGLRPSSNGADCRCSCMSAEGAAYQPACAILFSGRAPLWCGLTALSCSVCLISRGFAPGWNLAISVRPHRIRGGSSLCNLGQCSDTATERRFLPLRVWFPGFREVAKSCWVVVQGRCVP